MAGVRRIERVLRKSKTFLVPSLSLALGIACTSLVFSVVNAILLRPVPLRDANRVMMIWESVGSRTQEVSSANYQDLLERNRSFDELGAVTLYTDTYRSDKSAYEISIGEGTPSLFRMTGVVPERGRLFTESETRSPDQHVALVTDAFWKTQLQGRADVVGQPITLRNRMYTIVGVLPSWFDFPQPIFPRHVDIWEPAELAPQYLHRLDNSFFVFGRARKGMTDALIAEDLGEIGKQLSKTYPRTNTDLSFTAKSVRSEMLGPFARSLRLLIPAAFVFLVLAVVNLGVFLVAYFETVRKEMAVRSALGASPASIAELLGTDFAVLAGMTALWALPLVWAGTKTITYFLEQQQSRIDHLLRPLLSDVKTDSRVMIFSLGVCFCASALPFLLPWLRFRNLKVHTALQAGSGGGHARGGWGKRNLLVGLQICFTLMVLHAAAAKLKEFVAGTDLDLGYDPSSLLTAKVELPYLAVPQYNQAPGALKFAQELAMRLRNLPPVANAGITVRLPVSKFLPVNFETENPRERETGRTKTAWVNANGPEYLNTLGARIVRGRNFTAADNTLEAASTAVINESMERAYWGSDAVGRRLKTSGIIHREFTVIGVVHDIRQGYGDEYEAKPAMYLAFAQFPTPTPYVVVRAKGNAAGLSADITRVVHDIEPQAVVEPPTRMSDYLDRAVTAPRASATALATASGIALLLACFGIFANVAYTVSTRAEELGLKIALGASRGRIRQSIWHWYAPGVMGGLLGGAIGSYALEIARGGAAQGEFDWKSLAITAAVLMVGSLAAAVPSLVRAARLSPADIMKRI